MSGKALLQWVAALSVLGALVAYAARPDGRPVALAAQPTGGLTFAADFPEADRQWVLGAIAKARPEARQLLDGVAGRTRVVAFYAPAGYYLGWAKPRATRQLRAAAQPRRGSTASAASTATR